MRTAVLVGLFVMATPAAAQPSGAMPGFPLPSQQVVRPFQPRYAAPHSDAPVLMGTHEDFAVPPETRTLSLGPLRLESQTETTGRKQRHVARIRLDGVSFLGASIGGSVDGRGATVSLHWSN